MASQNLTETEKMILQEKWNKLTKHQQVLVVDLINSLLKKQAKNMQSYGFDNSTYSKVQLTKRKGKLH